MYSLLILCLKSVNLVFKDEKYILVSYYCYKYKLKILKLDIC